jgi:hypothetical protein
MTEFEMAYLLNDMQINLVTQFGVVLTVISGFLIAGFTISHRLNALMITISLLMYSWYMWVSVNGLARGQLNVIQLGRKMQTFAADGKGLEWHVAYTYPLPTFAMDNIWTVSITFGASMYAGSVALFFLFRHMNQKRELEEVAARTKSAIAVPSA